LTLGIFYDNIEKTHKKVYIFMKNKVLLLLILIIVFMGCQVGVNPEVAVEKTPEELDAYYENVICGKEIYYSEKFTKATSPMLIGFWIFCTLDYASDDVDEGASPRETMERGYGDCEDFCILFVNIYYINTGKKLDIGIVRYNDRAIVNGTWGNHAVVLDEDIIIEGQTGAYADYSKTEFRYTFDEIFGEV
jgi:hypothetical protein